MTNRIPLVVDIEDGNKLKELPAGDNLNLEGSGLINATSISTTGAITAASINVGGTALQALATTANYDDLNNTPTLFSGDYNDLQNKPFIPLRSNDLQNVSSIAPANGEALLWNSVNNQWEPNSIVSAVDAVTNLQDLQNVIISGAVDNKYLKYYSGAWRAANVTYAEVQNTPTNVSEFVNDAGYITSETDSQSLSIVGSNLTISNGNTVDLGIPTSLSELTNDGIIPTVVSQLTNDAGYITAETDSQTLSLAGNNLTITNGNTVDLSGIVGDSVGNFTFASSVIDTDDSSTITMTPAVVMSSDLTVENDLTVAGDIVTTSTGTPELFSESNINLTATTRVEVTQSPFKLASFSDTERNALTAENGDTIYNTTNNRPEMYVNGAWKIVDTSPIV
jgi:hypothetical protein